MYPQDPVVEDALFNGKGLNELQNLIDRLDVELTANEFIAVEDAFRFFLVYSQLS